jgi:hypothetical protein
LTAGIVGSSLDHLLAHVSTGGRSLIEEADGSIPFISTKFLGPGYDRAAHRDIVR